MTMRDREKLGHIIRCARKNVDLTQKELAEILGVSTGTVQQWELGVRYPRFPMLKKIESTLKITLINDSYEFRDVPGGDASPEQKKAIESWVKAKRKQRLIAAYDTLNDTGQKIAISQVESLASQAELQRTSPTEPQETDLEGGE